uniref:Glucosamine/galactosamine-6-phosphate isomerase domain-containing protein n=1 Tax=Amphora coffeiformis TaxID=265554 RepID=A0A7S3KYE1_9STRA
MAPRSSNFLLTVGATAAATAAAMVGGYMAYQQMVADQAKEPRARVLESPEDVAQELCAHVVEKAREAIEKRGVFHLAVAGGSLLDLLGGLAHHRDVVDFSKVIVSFVHYKCVAPTNAEKSNNLAKAKAKFADAAGITKFVVPTTTTTSTGQEEDGDGSQQAEFYARALVSANVPHSGKYPVMDLVLLGLGTDGHVGSCHPHSVAALETSKGVTGSAPLKTGEPSSITLTIESMNTARQTCVIACGSDKKYAVKRAMIRPAEAPRGTFPAQSLSAPLFFLDAEAAALL